MANKTITLYPTSYENDDYDSFIEDPDYPFSNGLAGVDNDNPARLIINMDPNNGIYYYFDVPDMSGKEIVSMKSRFKMGASDFVPEDSPIIWYTDTFYLDTTDVKVYEEEFTDMSFLEDPEIEIWGFGTPDTGGYILFFGAEIEIEYKEPYNKVTLGDEVLIDMTSATAEPGDVLLGKSYFGSDGARTVGTLGTSDVIVCSIDRNPNNFSRMFVARRTQVIREGATVVCTPDVEPLFINPYTCGVREGLAYFYQDFTLGGVYTLPYVGKKLTKAPQTKRAYIRISVADPATIVSINCGGISVDVSKYKVLHTRYGSTVPQSYFYEVQGPFTNDNIVVEMASGYSYTNSYICAIATSHTYVEDAFEYSDP